MPGGALEPRLLTFLRSVEDSSSVGKLAKIGLAVDPNLKKLVETFPRKLFWSAVQKLSIDTYPPDEEGVLYQLDFDAVDYPYAKTFAEQLKTWLRPIRCTEVESNVTYNFSKLSLGNLLLVKGSYESGSLAVFVGAGVSRQAGLPLWGDLLNELTEVYAAKVSPDPEILRNLQIRDLQERAR